MDLPACREIVTYLKEVEFKSPNTPGLFFESGSSDNEINIEVQSNACGGLYYQVELHVHMSPKVKDMVIFDMNLVYCVMIELQEVCKDKEGLEHLLRVIVPLNLYDHLRSFV